MSNQLSDRLCPGLSPCPVLTARLATITTSRIRNLGQDLLGREPTPSQAPLQIHQSFPTDVAFHASLRTMSSSPDHVPLASSLTRLRLSACLCHSPSISQSGIFHRLQLHLQHYSLVEDQSTPRPVDFKFSLVYRLESTLHHCMSKNAPLRHAPCVSTPTEYGHHQPSRFYVVVADSHRLLYPSDCTCANMCLAHRPHYHALSDTLCMHDPS
jgi:hypothetical protein